MVEPARILIIDDDPVNRALLRIGLEREGHRVDEAENGALGLEVLATGLPDLVITDIEMPEMDGYEVLRRRHDDPRLLQVPFIVISAVGEMASVVRCIELGAEDYLPKPFDAVLLRARINASLEKKRLRDQEIELLETVRGQADELRRWNQELETRVAEKVREVEGLRRLEGFVAPQVANVIVNGGAEMLESHRREITVLFCDLRGFTSFAETAEPEDVTTILRELHEAIGPLIFRHEGTVPHFTGDGLMVIFNDPLPCEDPALRAVLLAVGMRDGTAVLSQSWERRGHQLQMGIGIAIGYATCGRIGFEGRSEYTAIGTVTNLASRLCGAAAGGQILVADRIHAMVEGAVESEEVGPLELKGLTRPVRAFNILGLSEG